MAESITVTPIGDGNTEFLNVMVDLVQGVKSAVDSIPTTVVQLLANERKQANIQEPEEIVGTKKKAEEKPAPKKADKK